MKKSVPNKEDKDMKRKRMSIILLIVLLILVVPLPTGQARDGGTRTYTALTYRIVCWHRLCDDGTVFDRITVYPFPFNFEELDELFEIELRRTGDG